MKTTKDFVYYEIDRSLIVVETKEKLLVRLSSQVDKYIWINKKLAKLFNSYKLAFHASFTITPYEGKEAYIQVFNFNNEKLGTLHPKELEQYFRKIAK